jgi:hypothetical protein
MERYLGMLCAFTRGLALIRGCKRAVVHVQCWKETVFWRVSTTTDLYFMSIVSKRHVCLKPLTFTSPGYSFRVTANHIIPTQRQIFHIQPYDVEKNSPVRSAIFVVLHLVLGQHVACV